MKRIFTVFALTACALMLTVSIAFAVDGNNLSGKVLDTVNSGGYTYVQIDDKGAKVWVAVPEAKVTKGKVASFQPGMPMKNFKSKTLNRTFDVIYFSGGLAK